MKCLLRATTALILLALLMGACTPAAKPGATVSQAVSPLPRQDTPASNIPYGDVSLARMLADEEVLTTIQAYSGYRTAGTQGEDEAFTYVEQTLANIPGLQALGIEIEKQEFPIFVTTEIRETGLFLTGKDDQEIEVKANGLRGSRYNLDNALYFDTDGALGDTAVDPQEGSGPVLLVNTGGDLFKLTSADVKGKVLFLDEHLFDPYSNDAYKANRNRILEIMDMGITATIWVTEYSNRDGLSHGALIGDGSFLQNSLPTARVPVLTAKIEDMAPAGIKTWEDLAGMKTARVRLDSDVISPALSHNLIAHIPGEDPTHAMIISAHLDSPNSPGGFDDGSGSVILLELARVLGEKSLRPPVDLYLGWYGSHENGLYGSAFFAASHPEVLDRALAQLQLDCLGLPMEGNTAALNLDFNSYSVYGDAAANWQAYLLGQAALINIPLRVYDEYGLVADNSNFDTYNVPEADLIYYDTQDYESFGNGYIHYSNHFHDQYETADLVAQSGDQLVQMAQVALLAAMQTGRDLPELRTPPAPTERALIVGSHTQAVSMITSLRELGMALAWNGYDVDALAYGQPVTTEALADASVVVLLPTLDFTGTEETWAQSELDALDAFVQAGGQLVVTNSRIAHIMTVPATDPNEDVLALNPLLAPMGVTFTAAEFFDNNAFAAEPGTLNQDAGMVSGYGAGVPFTLSAGQVVYQAGSQPAVALIEYGRGRVIVIADLGMLIDNGTGSENLGFIQDLGKFLAR